MVRFYKNLVHPEENILSVCKRLVRAVNVPLTTKTLKDKLTAHPEYPSMLSMCDVLTEYGIDNASTRLPTENLADITTPFVALVTDDQGNEKYDLITEYNNDFVYSLILGKVTWDNFVTRYNDVVLLVEPRPDAGEVNYREERRNEKIKNITLDGSILFIPIIVIAYAVFHLFSEDETNLSSIIYMVGSLTGWVVTTMLLWYEIDSNNVALKQVCGGDTMNHGNCNAILQSKGASIIGISWSAIGFSFFSAILFGQLIMGISSVSTLAVLCVSSILAATYIPFSLYYQAKVAKQWCPLCLTVQGVLALQLSIVLLFRWNSHLQLSNHLVIVLLVLFAIGVFTLLLTYQLVPIVKENRRLTEESRRHRRFMYDSQIFNLTLKQQKFIDKSADGLGITIGNPKAKYTIIKVCNPYCGPCAKAHPVVEKIIEGNENVKLQIVFTASNNDNDMTASPAKHLLAVAERGIESLTKTALKDWYNAEIKDYNAFALKYPLDGELAFQGEKIDTMREWCDKVDIQFTPTFFVNGYQLPEHYNVDDLEYLLKS